MVKAAEEREAAAAEAGTRAGDVKLKVPKLGKITFESAIIERYKRREISVEEAMVEMYLADVSCPPTLPQPDCEYYRQPKSMLWYTPHGQYWTRTFGFIP